jgi:putative flippase GtrA
MEQTTTVPQTVNSGIMGKLNYLLASRPVILQILRFGAIGVFNTAVDVLVLNYLSAQFGITKGAQISWVNIPGVMLAMIQSYFWNKYWTFEKEAAVNLLKNFLRLVSVGVVGVLVYGFVFLGAHVQARPVYFIGIFLVFILAQIVLWYVFGFFKVKPGGQSRVFLSFFLVSAIGFMLNTLVLYLVTTHGNLSSNSGDNLNFGKIVATLASLVWNFLGYKLFVFKH